MNISLFTSRDARDGVSPGSSLLVPAAMIAGSLIGMMSPGLGDLLSLRVDNLVLLLVTLVIFGTPLTRLSDLRLNFRLVVVAWVANFLIIPPIGFAIASLFRDGHPLMLTGLIIYFMSPCTDWFLGFTRLAHGNTILGTALIPLNMVTQVLLYPVYLHLFTAHQTVIETTSVTATTIGEWFLMPLILAAILRLILAHLCPAPASQRIRDTADRLVPFIIASLVFAIFAANISTLIEHVEVVPRILAAVFVFFCLTFALGEILARITRLAYPDQVLLAMTTAARNAPLMLGITMIAMPGQPLVYAALIIGMLVEFPHLMALTHLFVRRYRPSRDEESLLPFAVVADERATVATHS
ncbi:MAG TPA: hypothetical protein VNZ58_01455 [Thermomicrobiales bacterium]|nr:hypothetical protein [Thermomicrobiales bacterium]